MKPYDQLVREQTQTGEGRLAEFFDIDTDDPKEIERELGKAISHYEGRANKPFPVSPTKFDAEYQVSGYDEFRGKNYQQLKLEIGIKKSAKDLFVKFKMMEHIQLPAIYEDEYGNIWTKIVAQK